MSASGRPVDRTIERSNDQSAPARTLDLGGGHIGEVDGRQDRHHLEAQPRAQPGDPHGALLLAAAVRAGVAGVVVTEGRGREGRARRAVAASGGRGRGKGEGRGGLVGRHGAAAAGGTNPACWGVRWVVGGRELIVPGEGTRAGAGIRGVHTARVRGVGVHTNR